MTLEASNWCVTHALTNGVSNRAWFKASASANFSVISSVGLHTNKVTIEDIQLNITVLTQEIIKSYDT